MKDKKASILLLAIVCLAGIALAVAQPTVKITPWYHVETNITDTERVVRTFNVTINQTANVSWLINATEVLNKPNVNFSEYTNTSAAAGYWNVTAYDYNENGSDTRTWWWSVNVTANDTSPPTVIDWTPTGTKESVKTDITATFSEPMNSSTLNNATIIVCNSSGSTVTGDITYDNNANTTTFDPLNELEYNETYHVTITTGVQDRAGNNMSSDFCWNFTTHREIKTPFMITGYVSYRNGNPVLNPKVTLTNLNTSEEFTVKTIPTSNYYRMLNDSTHLRAGDVIRINVTDGTDFKETRYHIVTEEDIKNGGFRFKPDLIISEWSETWIELNKVFNITYTVKNIGDEDASKSNTTIYIERSDGILKKNDSIEPLAPGESDTSTVGPFNCPCRDIKVCADSDNAVDESNERNNCLEHESNCPLPDLDPRTPWWKDEIWFWDDYENGKYKIQYGIENNGEENASESITTINITIVARNGTRVSSDIINHSVPALPSGKYRYYENTSRRFTCLYNHTVLIEVCADGYNEIFESDESNNCMNAEIKDCPASVREPDLEIVNHSEEWIGKPANRTFNITYTVKNVGNAIANNSTACVHGKEDPVPALKPGDSHTNTVGPFNLLGFRTTIKLHADCKNNVSESHDGEEENCIEYTFGLPHLRFEYWEGEWVRNTTFRVKYGVWSFGGAASDYTTVYAHIDGNDSRDKNVTDTLSPIPPYVYRRYNSIGPFEMGDKKNVTYKLCMDRGDGEETCTGETVFGGGACVAEDGTRFTCGGFGGGVSRTTIITKSCTLTGDMYCPEGVLIRGNDIVIDGNGSGILGEKIGCTGTKDNPVTPDNHYKTLGIRIGWSSAHNININNVTIKNMNIRGFCNGIAIVNADDSRIENCSVHDNGVKDGYTYGITVVNSSYVSIHRCEVYNNTGNLTGMNVAGGHGINFEDGSNYCAVTNSHIFNNYLSGILASPTCKYLYIGNNTIEDNGQCNESGFCAGVNLHWKGGFGLTTNSTVENNTIQNNTGSGIYVTQSYTAIKNNTVKGGKNSKDVGGNGILVDGGKVTFLYNNTCCENEGTDIVNSVNSFATFGDDNSCDTTSNYNDEGTTRGCIYKCSGSGACIADDGSGDAYFCGDTVMKSCTFSQNISCPISGDGLIVGADDITINGTGYTLIGNFSGVGIFSNRFSVAIKNLQVKNFATGIKIENTTENTIENCTVRKNFLTGINFSADNGTVRNSRIYDNNGTGIFVGGNYSIFENNTMARNKGYGLYFSPDTADNTLIANAIGDNEDIDIHDADGQTNTGDNNTCDMAYNYRDTGMTDYNCTYPWTQPDLIISEKSEHWVDKDDKTYKIKYTIENDGEPKSREAGPSTTYLYIDTKPSEVARDGEVGSLKPGEKQDRIFNYTAKMSGRSDDIKVRADGDDEVKENNEADIFYCNEIGCYAVEELFEDKEANNCLKNVFSEDEEEGGGGPSIPTATNPNAACIGWDTGTAYRCSDPVLNTVIESCTFNDSMGCPPGHDGLIIGKKNITIDGNGFGLYKNTTTPADCEWADEQNPCTVSGIYNSGEDGVTIKNLEIAGFCTGIVLKGASGFPIRGNTIDNCNIYCNGFNTPSGGSEMVTHGIHMCFVSDTTIKGNEIHHNHGTGPGCGDGGNGIFFYAGSETYINNVITGNELHENDKAGFWTKMGLHNAEITNNEVWGNGIGWGVTDSQKGGIILRCKMSNHNTIKENIVYDNKGDGIFIGGSWNTISNNKVVNDNTKDGIDIERGGNNNTLSNNNVCGNGVDIGVDIKVCEDCPDNTGPDNCCNTTVNYADEGKDKGCTRQCPCGEKPDLTITDLSAEWVDRVVKTYKIEYTIANIGNGNASESTTHIWINDVFNRGDNVQALGLNESIDKPVGVTFTLSDDSDKITVCADGENKIKEHNELNNEMTYEFPPVLKTIVVLPPTANLSVGDTQKFTATAYDQNEPHHTIGEIVISWNSNDEMVGTVNPPSNETDIEGNATTVFTADGVGGTTITAESGGISGDAEVTVWFDPEELEDTDWSSHGGPGGPSGKENVTGYEPGPGGGTGPFGADIGGEQLPVNESGAASGGKTWETGHPFGLGGEIIENVKVVAPVFLIIIVVIFVALFYSGYFGEKRAHRRNKKRT